MKEDWVRFFRVGLQLSLLGVTLVGCGGREESFKDAIARDNSDVEPWVLEFERDVREGRDLSSEEVEDVVRRMMLLDSELDRSLVMGNLRGYVDWEVLGYFVDQYLSESVPSEAAFIERITLALVFARDAVGVASGDDWTVPTGLMEAPEEMRKETVRQAIVERWREYVKEHL